jgi:phosphatidate cytidylyltransferase
VLKQRVLTASVLASLIIWGLFSLSTPMIASILAFVVLLGGWEWARLIGMTSTVARAAYVAAVLAVLWLAQRLVVDNPSALTFILAAAALWWLAGTVMVLRYRGESGLSSFDRVTGLVIGLLVLTPTWLALVYLHGSSSYGPALVLFIFMLIWGADVGAYFAGRKFGKRKLAPNVSPGKTVEGVFGGMAMSAVVAAVGMMLFKMPLASAFWFIPLCFVVVIFSVIGDLFESLFKRRVGVKDSGQLLPGHGGILDRIDSLTTAAPIFVLGLILFGGIK